MNGISISTAGDGYMFAKCNLMMYLLERDHGVIRPIGMKRYVNVCVSGDVKSLYEFVERMNGMFEARPNYKITEVMKI